ncbi:MAG: hypothetical protein ABSA64_04640 [Sedimentisphaerales bacterium]|jgi:hypothetical protein
MKPYKQKPGEFEIRILPDGRVLMPAPDEAMLDVSRALKQPDAKQSYIGKAKKNVRAKASGTKQGGRRGRSRKNERA